MIVDSSPLVAIMGEEPDAELYVDAQGEVRGPETSTGVSLGGRIRF